MITRRTALGVGLAALSTAGMTGFRAYAAVPGGRVGPIDALLVDQSIEMPRQMAAYIETRSEMLPVFAVRLDAAGYSGLMDILRKSHAIAGISSGATLFCLERLAWNHGYRLTGRTEQCLSVLNNQTCQQDMAAFLRATHISAAPDTPVTAHYRPSQDDDTVHGWVMQKTGSAHPGSQHRQTNRMA